jgi:hypothetical protein
MNLMSDDADAVRRCLQETEDNITACPWCVGHEAYGPVDALRAVLWVCDREKWAGVASVRELRYAIAEALDEDSERRRCGAARRWGPWTLDPDTARLHCHTDTSFYCVDLRQCTSPAKVLDKIFGLVEGPVVGGHAVVGLLRAVADILHPRIHLCAGGERHVIGQGTIEQLVAEAAQAVADV